MSPRFSVSISVSAGKCVQTHVINEPRLLFGVSEPQFSGRKNESHLLTVCVCLNLGHYYNCIMPTAAKSDLSQWWGYKLQFVQH